MPAGPAATGGEAAAPSGAEEYTTPHPIFETTQRCARLSPTASIVVPSSLRCYPYVEDLSR